MIGHFVDQLTCEQEERVLVESFEPYQYGVVRCLVDVANGAPANSSNAQYFPFRPGFPWQQCGVAWVGNCYDLLCRRFGAPRVNAAIRNRILSNRAWRTLSRPAVVSGSTENT